MLFGHASRRSTPMQLEPASVFVLFVCFLMWRDGCGKGGRMGEWGEGTVSGRGKGRWGE